MSEDKHPDYELERDRLNYTIDYLNKTLKGIETFKRVYKGNIEQAMEGLDPGDMSSGFASIMVNSRLMYTAEKNYYNYIKAKNKPYFARIDFKRKGEEKVNRLYIGKTSLIRAEDNEVVIVDWRAPVASLYYEGRLGETSYESVDNIEEGELLLKRQFTIEEGELKKIFDVDITTNDELLQEALSAGAESRLKDIAATIQAEQNRIIRAPMYKPLIVQGVAGSGKTTIALHRIAYFIYNYEDSFDPESFMIIAPNNLFINYISEVLPELGVEKVQQNTYKGFMDNLLNKKISLIDNDDKLMKVIHNKDKKEVENIKWSSGFKGSLVFKELIDRYIDDIEKNFLPDEDFAVGKEILIDRQSIKQMFLNDLAYHPFYKRVEEIKKSLRNKVKLVKKDMLKTEERLYDIKIERARVRAKTVEERRKLITELCQQRDKALVDLTNELKNAVRKFSKSFNKRSWEEYYYDLVTSAELMDKYSDGRLPKDKLEYFCKVNKNNLDSAKYEIEDYGAIVYLKLRVFGFENKVNISSVVVDEAQDFSIFQLYTLKKVVNSGMITLLGDLSQGIHSYRAVDNWQQVQREVFGEDESSYMTLEQSYRTTVEVMHIANQIIKKLNNSGIIYAKPVIRHGLKPDNVTCNTLKDLVFSVIDKLIEVKKENFKSFAIICKTYEECQKLTAEMQKQGYKDVRIIDEKQENYEAGVIVVPAHMAKGLEFDVVFIVNIEESYVENEMDIKLLYVAMTRPMHRLYLYSLKDTMPILKDVNFN
ncbi:RNA polymerase recycling motor HelD [Clostridium oryzae]|uniref:Helicase IV n=1 Tax=Clostridium oryzae TaxID=1450648 RepID=A0A1V4IQF3_9CLOT|nr:RNA polymerase recycling motor HelD [Clostridium oryzae]OPJ62133.1 helicase IV [Clostridium oryzae]